MRMQDVRTFEFGGQTEAASIDTLLDVVSRDIWSDEAITAHKADELAKALPESALWKYLAQFRRARKFVMKGPVVFPTLIAATVGFMLGAFLWGLRAYGIFVPYMEMFTLFSAGVAIMSLSVMVTFDTLQRRKVLGPARWISYRVLEADESMPKRAHELMANVKALMPDVRFYVHKLAQNQEELDPILEVTRKNPLNGRIEKRYILVWDAEGNITPPPV